MNDNFKSREEVQKQFQSLLKNFQNDQKKIQTKEEQVVKEEALKVMQKALTYSPELIVKDLANLQLELSNNIELLSSKINDELLKSEDLNKAVNVQQDNIKNIHNIKIAANALYILKKEQEQRKNELEIAHKEKSENLEKTQEKLRTDWEKEAIEFQNKQQEEKDNLEKNRLQELSDYRYNLERTYTKEKDAYTEKKKFLIRDLADQDKVKENDWSNRIEELDGQKEEFEKNKQKVDNFEEELKVLVKEAKDKAMTQASKENKEAMQIFEKDVEGHQRISEQEIINLNNTIERNKELLAQLSTELKEAQMQVQTLSLKALESNMNKSKLN